MRAISLRLEPTQYERLRVLSFAMRKPVAEIIREAIDTHLQKQAVKPGQEWFWTEAWQAEERAVETELAAGQHETFDNVQDFLAGLE